MLWLLKWPLLRSARRKEWGSSSHNGPFGSPSSFPPHGLLLCAGWFCGWFASPGLQPGCTLTYLTLIIVVSLQIFSVLNSDDAAAPALETQPQGDEEGEPMMGNRVGSSQRQSGAGKLYQAAKGIMAFTACTHREGFCPMLLACGYRRASTTQEDRYSGRPGNRRLK